MNKKIQKILQSQFIDYFGVADLRNYQSELESYGGKIVKGYKYGMSIGIVLPNTIVDFLPDRKDVNIACEYKIHAYEVINNRLDIVSSMIASFLNQKGYRTLPIPALERTDVDNGPRVRFTSLLSNAPLTLTGKPMREKCGTCHKCRDICPSLAIKGRNYIDGESREKRLDFIKCQDYFDELKKDTKIKAVCGMCLMVCPYGKKKKDVLS